LPTEHLGSTAVHGLPAKPVAAIMAPVRALEESMLAVRTQHLHPVPHCECSGARGGSLRMSGETGAGKVP